MSVLKAAFSILGQSLKFDVACPVPARAVKTAFSILPQSHSVSSISSLSFPFHFLGTFIAFHTRLAFLGSEETFENEHTFKLFIFTKYPYEC